MRPKPTKLPKELGLSPDLQLFEMKPHTPEWYAFRHDGIGGSETGGILNYSDYSHPIKEFYKKVECKDDEFQNEHTFHGKHQEAYIKNLWRYSDGEEGGYMANFDKDNVIRKSVSVGGYVINPKYPHLFASVDDLIPIGQFKISDGEILDKPAILEIKRIGSREAKRWRAGIPQSQLVQVHQYMLVYEVDYAEMGILTDGTFFSVKAIDRNEDLCKKIADESYEFWHSKIVPGKEAYQELVKCEQAMNFALAEEYQSILYRLEPDPDDSEQYKEFMTAKAILQDSVIKGGMDEFDMLCSRKDWAEIKKLAIAKELEIENKMRKYLQDNRVDKVDFDKHGYAGLSMRSNSTNLTFNNRVKHEPDMEHLASLIKMVDERIN